MNYASRNDLYRTIIESIIKHKNGDNIKVIVTFKLIGGSYLCTFV